MATKRYTNGKQIIEVINGEQGPKGDTGQPGPQGPQGAEGPRGYEGYAGLQGDTGPKGDKGDPGLNGVDGVDGAQGSKGDKGDTGEKGDKGDKGDRGDPGRHGVNGRDGKDGKDGKEGREGPRGHPGMSGGGGGTTIDLQTLQAKINPVDGDLVLIADSESAPQWQKKSILFSQVGGGGTDSNMVKANADDPTPGYLDAKIDNSTITLNSNNQLVAQPGGYWLAPLWYKPEGAIAYVDPTTFTIQGDEFGYFPKGSRVVAELNSWGPIQGTVVNCQLYVVDGYTKIYVVWDNIQLDNTITAVYSSRISPRDTAKSNVNPNPQAIDMVTRCINNMSLASAHSDQKFEMNSASPRSFILPDPVTGVANGTCYHLANIGTGLCTIIGVVNGVTNPTMVQYQRITVLSNGTEWVSPDLGGGSGLRAVVDDPSPMLGGNLNADSFNITDVYDLKIYNELKVGVVAPNNFYPMLSAGWYNPTHFEQLQTADATIDVGNHISVIEQWSVDTTAHTVTCPSWGGAGSVQITNSNFEIPLINYIGYIVSISFSSFTSGGLRVSLGGDLPTTLTPASIGVSGVVNLTFVLSNPTLAGGLVISNIGGTDCVITRLSVKGTDTAFEFDVRGLHIGLWGDYSATGANRFDILTDGMPGVYKFANYTDGKLGNNLQFHRARGISHTISTTKYIEAGDQIFTISSGGCYGSSNIYYDTMQVVATENWNNGSGFGTKTIFGSTLNGGASMACYPMVLTGTNVGVGNVGLAGMPLFPLDVFGDNIRIQTAKTPQSATATGTAGQICWDADYIYVCVDADTWKRSPIATW